MMKMAILRMKDKKDESIALGEENGFEVMFASPLELAELETPDFWRFVAEAESGKTGRVVFTSATSVKYLFSLLERAGKASAVFTSMNKRGTIAIGPMTMDAAKAKWLKAEALPEKFSSEGLSGLVKDKVAKGETVWVIRSDKEVPVIKKGLEGAGAIVEEVAVYSLRKVEPDRALLDMYYFTVHGGIDVYAFTSPSSAQVFIEEGENKYGVRQFGTSLNESVIAALDEPTRKMLESMGVDVDVMPKNATFEDMLKAIKIYIEKAPNL